MASGARTRVPDVAARSTPSARDPAVRSIAAGSEAWREQPYYAQLKRWAEAGIHSNRQVIVRIGKRTIAVLPDREVDLGPMEPGERVLIESEPGPTGVTFSARRAPA